MQYSVPGHAAGPALDGLAVRNPGSRPKRNICGRPGEHMDAGAGPGDLACATQAGNVSEMECEVPRCGNPVESVLDVSPPGSGPVDVGVCAKHRSEIGRGARWLFEREEGSDGRLGRLLMGRDLPPRVVRAQSRTLTSSDGVTRLFTFEVDRFNGSRREVEFELPPGEIADGIWRILGRGRATGQ
jgi:hypothetical protein